MIVFFSYKTPILYSRCLRLFLCSSLLCFPWGKPTDWIVPWILSFFLYRCFLLKCLLRWRIFRLFVLFFSLKPLLFFWNLLFLFIPRDLSFLLIFEDLLLIFLDRSLFLLSLLRFLLFLFLLLIISSKPSSRIIPAIAFFLFFNFLLFLWLLFFLLFWGWTIWLNWSLSLCWCIIAGWTI